MEYVNELPHSRRSCYFAQHLDFPPNASHDITDDALADVLLSCPNIETATLSGIPDLSDRTVIRLANAADRLAEVDLSGCTEVTDISMLDFARLGTAVEVLKLNGVAGLTDRAICALARLPRVVELELCDLPLVTAFSVRDIWFYCRQLRRLRLSSCTHLTDKAFPNPPPSDGPTQETESVGKRGKSSTEPSRPSSWLDALPPLDLAGIHKFSELRSLDLSYCHKITDTAIAGVMAHSPRITDLNLSGCVLLTDRALKSICTLGFYLCVLAVRSLKLTELGITALVAACKRLRSVDVSFIRRLTDLAILELGTLPSLDSLIAVGLTKITDNALLFLAEHTQTLERLNLSRCRELSLSAIHVAICKLGHLKHLTLCGVPALNRIGMRRFSDQPPEGYVQAKQGLYWEFWGDNLRALQRFLDKEEWRRRETERLNIIFRPRADDSVDLY